MPCSDSERGTVRTVQTPIWIIASTLWFYIRYALRTESLDRGPAPVLFLGAVRRCSSAG